MRPLHPAALVASIGVAAPARAQVNAELLASAARDDGVGLTLSAGTALAVGNVDLLDVHGDVALQVRTSFAADDPEAEPWLKDRVIVALHGAFRTIGGAPVLDERLGHLRYTRMVVPRVGVDVFAQIQNDRSLLLDWRFAGGPGVRVVALNDPRIGLWGGTGYMVEYEVRRVPDDGPDPPRVLNHRWTTYLAWRAALVPDRLTWLNTAYVQPRFDDVADVQVVDETRLEVAVSPAFAFTTALRLRWDSRPPADLDPLDVRWTTGLTVRVAPRRRAPPPAP